MGRRLTSLTNEANNVTYSYDAAGQRISKTVNGVTTEFYYDDRGALVLMSRDDGTEIYFYPDADGSIGSIGYNGNRYYYVRNAQNDIIGITDKTGAFVARYTYDEWGNITSITDGNGNDVSGNPNHIANLNPLRYRSYFYDAETGWCWLNTRYYDPAIGRFINADGYASTGQGMLGFNMFAYCGNNPVNMVDYTGEIMLNICSYFAVSIKLLYHWVYGDGKAVTFDQNSVVSYKLSKSKIMEKEIEEQIRRYENGKGYGSGSVFFNDNEIDLWLGIRWANYELSIEEETKDFGFWKFKTTKTRYKVKVRVSDVYDFNTGDETGDGIGSILNNFGYWAQENGLGNSYSWRARFDYYTDWK